MFDVKVLCKQLSYFWNRKFIFVTKYFPIILDIWPAQMLPICVFAIGTYASWSCEHIKQKNEYKPEDKKQTNKTVKDENDSKKI